MVKNINIGCKNIYSLPVLRLRILNMRGNNHALIMRNSSHLLGPSAKFSNKFLLFSNKVTLTFLSRKAACRDVRIVEE